MKRPARIKTEQKGVESLKSIHDIEKIRKRLDGKPRELLLFDMAVQTGVPIKQLLDLKVKDVAGLTVGDLLPLKPVKRLGEGSLQITDEIHQSLKIRLEQAKKGSDEYLFASRKGPGPLTMSSASRLMKNGFKAVGLDSHIGLRSLRKTWERHFSKISDEAGTKTLAPQSNYKFNQLTAITRQEAVYREIRKTILSGKIEPGAQIETKNIAQQMGVSQIPVREALLRLEQQGFISKQASRALVVKPLSYEELEETIRIRLDLEGTAAIKNCKELSWSKISHIETLFNQFSVSINEIDTFLANHRKFHFAIYQLDSQPVLKNIIEMLWDKTSPYLSIYWREFIDSGLQNTEEVVDSHRSILKAIKNQDPKALHKAIVYDLGTLSDNMKKWLRLLNELD